MNSPNYLKGKTALVTGGAARIGREICLTLANAGASVAVHYRTSGKAAEELVAQIQANGGRAAAIQADLRSEEACGDLIQDAGKLGDPLSILINSAAVFNRESIHQISAESILGEFWPNLFSPMLLSRYFAAGKPGDGVIINMLDRRIAANDERYFAYSLAKKSLADFTRLAAVALAPSIKVHGIAPGPVLPPPGESDAYLKENGGRRLIGDKLDPAAVAEAVMALISLRGATGQILYIDAGQHLLGNGV